MAERDDDDDGWVRLDSLKPGDLFNREDSESNYTLLSSGGSDWLSCSRPGAFAYIRMPSDTLVRPLTAVRVHPSHDSDLRAMLLAALATGDPVTLGALCDLIQERGLDPDARRAVIERCARECFAANREPSHYGAIDGNSLWTGVDLGYRIRQLQPADVGE